MKNRLILLLLLLASFAQAQTTGEAFEPISWDQGGNVVYGRVRRSYVTYPAPAKNADFYAAINAGTLPVEERFGPLWATVRVTYLGAKNHLEVEAQASANLQLKFERLDGTALSGGNPEGLSLQSGVYYGSGPSGQSVFTKHWVFGQDRTTGAGGIPSVFIKLTFKNLDTGEEYSHVFKPINKASRTLLFRSGSSSPPVSSTPAWVSARYSYTATTSDLQIETAGDPMQLKFERVDGVALSGSNPDVPGLAATLASGVFYGNGPLTGQGSYDKQWRFGKAAGGVGGIPTVPLRLTFKRNSDNSTYAFTFTPTTTTRQQLFVSGGGTITPTTACDFNISTSNQSGVIGTGITLSASVSGADASAAVYTWTGTGGFTSIGQSVQVTLPTTPGTYAYVLTASKSGCANKTATSVVTVTSGSTPPPAGSTTFSAGYGEGSVADLMAFAPFVPSNNQVDSWQVGNTTQYVTTSAGLKFGINNSIGGSVTHLSLNGGQNLINTTTQRTSIYKGVLSPDNGRSQDLSSYGFPDGFRGGPGSQNGRFVDTGTDGQVHVSSAIGWNAVPGGEDGNANRGIILFYERRNVTGYGEVLYTKNQTYQWGMNNVLVKQYRHYWTWGEGQAMGWFAILENFRDDTQGLYQAREQEHPFVFPIATYYRKVAYVGSAPGTFGSLSEFTKPEPCEGAGLPGCPNANDTGDWLASEYWAAGMKGDGSMLVANVTPYNTRFRGKQEQSHSGDEFTNATSYINSAVMVNYDEPLTRAYSGYIYAGSPSDFRNWYYNKNFQTTPFSWDFTGGNTNRWWSENGFAKKVSGRYTFNYGFGRPGDVGTPLEGTTVHFASITSPHGAWKAQDIPKIYIKGRFSGGGTVTQFKLKWRKPGLSEGATEYEKSFSINPTTAEQTIVLDMTGESNWSGIISFIRIGMANFQQSTNGDEVFIPSYIGRNQP